MDNTGLGTKFRDFSLFFVTADVKRGLGLEQTLPDFHIITGKYDTTIALLRKFGLRVFCLEEEGRAAESVNNTGSILADVKTSEYIRSNSKGTPAVSFFKPSLKIDQQLGRYGFLQIGNPHVLNEKYENKVRLENSLGKAFGEILIPGEVSRMSDLDYGKCLNLFGNGFVVQFGHGWAGKDDFFITAENQLEDLKQKYPRTSVRVSAFVDGFTVLNNCCIYQGKVLVGPPALQVNGIPLLSENPQVTCGRQWPDSVLSGKSITEIESLSRRVGGRLIADGYRGFFGIDFLVSGSSGRVHISEVNARLTASSAFYAELELAAGGVPLLAFHYASFLGIDLPLKYIASGITGSQISVRNPLTARNLKLAKSGLYALSGEKIEFISEDYRIGSVKPGQFLFNGNPRGGAGSEFARIESVDKVLKKPGHLADWLKPLIA